MRVKMKYLFNKIAILLLGLVIVSCSSEEDVIAQWISENPKGQITPVTGSSGSLDLSKYVAVGNSLTAGFQDGALYTDGQQNSFPNLLATQFQISGVGGGSFNQPDINSTNGFHVLLSDIGAGRIVGRTILDLSDQVLIGTKGDLPGIFAGDKTALNNFGVPGIVTAQLLTPLTGTATFGNVIHNPLYTRFASTPGRSTILADAVATKPTFFTLWIGANDYLGYAITGGIKDSDITETTSFQISFTTVLNTLVSTGAKGVVLTLPPVVTLPFFQAVTAGENGVNLIPLDVATATVLNLAYKPYNDGIDLALAGMAITKEEAASRKISFSPGNNAPVILDENLTDLRSINPAFVNIRQAKTGDLFTLPAATVIGTLKDSDDPTSIIGVAVPISDQYTLTTSEQAAVVTARATFNGIIMGVVNTIATAGADITLVDIQPTFADAFGLDATEATALALSTAAIAAADGVLGIRISGGVPLTPDFAPNGLFSTDGIHPNPRGAAIISNLIIDAMNAKWKASIPKIDVLSKRGVFFQN